ncbi:MAG: hypothetical protein IKB82_02855 [Clostridia bacterium]|nr:hypothetical protein [Clostridia bacterium]
MKKIRTMLVMLLVAMILIMPMQASASTYANIRSVRQYNERCFVTGFFEECGKEIVRVANNRIEDIIEESVWLAKKANSPCEVKAIIAAMQVRTSAVSLAAQTAAALCGVKTVCEYVDVEIGGYVVAVDPLRVVLV